MTCDFERLCRYVNNELDHKRKHEVITHLRECEICLEAVCLMMNDRESVAGTSTAQTESAA